MYIPRDCLPDPSVNTAFEGVTKWITTADAKACFPSVSRAYSYDELTSFAKSLNEIALSKKDYYTYYCVATLSGDWYGLQRTTSSGVEDYVYWLAYFNGSAFLPCCAMNNDYSSAANTIKNYFVQTNKGDTYYNKEGDTITSDNVLVKDGMMYIPIDNSTNISIDEYVENLVKQYVTNYTYNIDDHSYTVNTFDTTYNVDNRSYGRLVHLPCTAM